MYGGCVGVPDCGTREEGLVTLGHDSGPVLVTVARLVDVCLLWAKEVVGVEWSVVLFWSDPMDVDDPPATKALTPCVDVCGRQSEACRGFGGDDRTFSSISCNAVS